jgi:SAM-dependent methyltransferase
MGLINFQAGEENGMNNLQSDLYTEFDKDPTPITAFVSWLADSYGLTEQLYVLDMGCGPGQMLREYERLGWHVAGMEPDADFYRRAREQIRDLPQARLYRGGFSHLNFKNEFDLITAVNNPFSYLLDVPARVEALKRIYQALKPGGVFFLELTNFLYKLQHFEPLTVQQKNVGGERVVHLMENQVNVHEARWLLRDQYIFEGRSGVIEKQHEQAVITLPELLYFFEHEGFVELRTYASYQARIQEMVNGEKILLAAQKPG